MQINWVTSLLRLIFENSPPQYYFRSLKSDLFQKWLKNKKNLGLTLMRIFSSFCVGLGILTPLPWVWLSAEFISNNLKDWKDWWVVSGCELNQAASAPEPVHGVFWLHLPPFTPEVNTVENAMFSLGFDFQGYYFYFLNCISKSRDAQGTSNDPPIE